MKPTAPGSLLEYIYLNDLFYLPFIFRSIEPKIQKYLAAIYSYLFYLAFDLSIYYNLFMPVLPIFGAVTRKGLTTPLIRRVASICYLCAGVVYVVLLGSLCWGLGATYANGWLIMVGASRTSPVLGNGMRRRHARRRILPSFGALRGDNTPTADLRGLRMITMTKCVHGCSLSCFLEVGEGKSSSLLPI